VGDQARRRQDPVRDVECLAALCRGLLGARQHLLGPAEQVVDGADALEV